PGPRRAHHRSRSAADHRDPEPHPDARRPAHRSALDAHPPRAVPGLRQGRDHQRGTHRDRGPAREPDPRPHARGRLHPADHRRHRQRIARRRGGRALGGATRIRNVFTIAGKELRSYFASPVAYVLLAAYLALAGYFFYALLLAFNQMLQIYSMMRNPEMLSRF